MALFSITPVARNGVAYTGVKNLNTIDVLDVRAATTDEITNFSTALTAVVVRTITYNQPNTTTYLTATATATAIAAYNAAQAGILGSGASGDAVLVAGTVAVTIPGLSTASKAILTRHIANTTTLTTGGYQYAVTANTLTITACVAAGTINVADISTITYAIVG